jgi:hypothetical protein
MAFIGANTSSTFVGNPGVFTSDYLRTDTHDYITGSVFSSSAGSFYLEQSPDGINWDPTTSGAVLNYTANLGGTANAAIAITANVSKGFVEQIILPFWRIRFAKTSASGAPASFQITTRTSDASVKY